MIKEMNELEEIVDMAETSIIEYQRKYGVCPKCHTPIPYIEKEACQCLTRLKFIRKHEIPYGDITFSS